MKLSAMHSPFVAITDVATGEQYPMSAVHLLVSNGGMIAAKNTTVRVQGVRLVNEPEWWTFGTSALKWADREAWDTNRYAPRLLSSGEANALPVDICKSDAAESQLKILCEAADRGLYTFTSAGRYEIKVTATGDGVLCIPDKVTVTVDYAPGTVAFVGLRHRLIPRIW